MPEQQTLFDFLSARPIEILLLISLITSLPFFYYYFKKKMAPVYQLYRGFKKPKTFDYDLISIGPDGTAFITHFIKKNPKARILVVRSTKSTQRKSHLSPEAVAKAKVDFLSGDPTLLSPFEVSLSGKIFSAENILLAIGAESNVPDFIGLEKVRYYTPTTIWSFSEVPKRILILGENQMACEWAQTYAERGSEVTLASSQTRLLPDEEIHICEFVYKNLTQQKIVVLLNARLEKFEKTAQQDIAIFEYQKSDLDVAFDVVLLCLGDIPNTTQVGLERLDILLNPDGTIKVDSSLRTNYPTIFACGKAAGIMD